MDLSCLLRQRLQNTFLKNVKIRKIPDLSKTTMIQNINWGKQLKHGQLLAEKNLLLE